jgi:hypothetical protein
VNNKKLYEAFEIIDKELDRMRELLLTNSNDTLIMIHRELAQEKKAQLAAVKGYIIYVNMLKDKS